MIYYLTSSPTGDLDGKFIPEGIDERNHFLENLRRDWKPDSRVLMIPAFPANHAACEEMTGFFAEKTKLSGLTWSAFDCWTDETSDTSEDALLSYDVIFLGGGHVPTQNRYFHEIGLREKVQKFGGIVIGISAGTMNAADIVYCQPEEPGEGIDPDFPHFIEGLGITKTQVLPHFQIVKDNILDGKKLYDEITVPDSVGHEFLVLPDGSYVRGENGEETIWGEHYIIRDGEWVTT